MRLLHWSWAMGQSFCCALLGHCWTLETARTRKLITVITTMLHFCKTSKTCVEQWVIPLHFSVFNILTGSFLYSKKSRAMENYGQILFAVTLKFFIVYFQSRFFGNYAPGLYSWSTQWRVVPNFCSWVTRKSYFSHLNHVLGTLDFLSSENWAPFTFFKENSLVHLQLYDRGRKHCVPCNHPTTKVWNNSVCHSIVLVFGLPLQIF